jgi:ribonuclease D
VEAAPIGNADVRTIADNDQLAEFCLTLQRFDPVALDTEGDSLHCYFEKLCLIQVGVPNQNLLIDPLAALDFAGFNQTLSQRQIILHGCDYDLRMLRRGVGFVPGPVFDTYLAAKLVGLKEVGLATLLKKFFGVDTPKSSQKANWAKRPLTPAMIAYAVNDTRYLLELAEKLERDLREKGRWEWFSESCLRAVQAAAEDRGKDPERIWKIPGSALLKGRPVAVLRALWLWRDAEARKADRPAFHIMRNEELLELAKAEGRPAFPRHVQGSRRARLEDAIQTALNLPESEWPRRVYTPSKRPTQEEEQRFDRLKRKRDQVAAELDLDPGMVASRQVLERIAREPATLETALMKWQREILGL